MKDNIPDIGIVYVENMLTQEDLEELYAECSKCNITIAAKGHAPWMMNAAIDDLVPTITVFLSSPIVQGIISGVAANIVCGLCKRLISMIKERTNSKPFYKVTSSSMTPIKPRIHMQADNIQAIFPADADENIINHYIDSLFGYLKSQGNKKHNETLYAFYDEDTGIIRTYTYCELAQKLTDEHKQSTAKKEAPAEPVIVEHPIKEKRKKNG